MSAKRQLTSRERLTAAFRREEPDRVPIHIRGVNPFSNDLFRKHPSYAPLVEIVRESCDTCVGWSVGVGFFLTKWVDSSKTSQRVAEENDDFLLNETAIHTPKGDLVYSRYVSKKGYPGMPHEFPVKTDADIEKALSIPYIPPKPDTASFFDLDKKVGDAGIVIANLGGNPVSHVHALLGSELMALWSIEKRELILRLLDTAAARMCDFAKHLIASGVGPFFGMLGQEYVAPPLHSPRDFADFNVRFDKRVTDIIHEAGGLVHVHCHGSLNAVLEKFIELGADCLHPVEAPPLGDVALADAKRRIGRAICIEGNIQIGDIYTCAESEIVRQVKAAIHDAAPGGGYILCPTASPHWPRLEEKVFGNYAALIRTARAMGMYPIR